MWRRQPFHRRYADTDAHDDVNTHDDPEPHAHGDSATHPVALALYRLPLAGSWG
jgi:hypothetical protein